MQLTELQNKTPEIGDIEGRINEMQQEDDIKRDIIKGKGTKTIMSKYGVSREFINTCRKELRNEALI